LKDKENVLNTGEYSFLENYSIVLDLENNILRAHQS